MSKAEEYYREVNSLPPEEFPILGRDDHRIIELINDFHEAQIFMKVCLNSEHKSAYSTAGFCSVCQCVGLAD
jgi:hypothetical protein